MYSLDINFLKERNAEKQPKPRPTGEAAVAAPAGSRTPIIVGAAVGLLVPAAVVAFWLWTNQQTQRVQAEVRNLEAELAQLEASRQEIEQRREQLAQAEAEADQLANIFNQVKSVSAIIQDIRDRLPAGVRVATISQVETRPSQRNAQANAQADSSALPTVSLSISGHAESYEALNYFLLTLQRSAFLDSDQTRLDRAQEVDYPSQFELPEDIGEVEAPEVVEFTIASELNNQSASELLTELAAKGASGLVTRIRTLQEQGIILSPPQQPAATPSPPQPQSEI